MNPLLNTKLSLRSLLYYSAVTVALCLVIGYTLFQARFILTGPVIVMGNDPQTVQNQRVVTLEGSTENIVKLALNGRQIFTNKEGEFTETLVLENGYTITTLEAHDRYGRTRTYTQKFVYVPTETP